jgi:hypothetical protein
LIGQNLNHNGHYQMSNSPGKPFAGPATRSFLWRLVVHLHLVAAATWWWLMPGGFPLVHARFWTNQVFPLAAIALCLACLWAERRGHAVLRGATAVTIPAFWLAAMLAAVVVFPYSARRFLPPAIAGTYRSRIQIEWLSR